MRPIERPIQLSARLRFQKNVRVFRHRKSAVIRLAWDRN
jgi:hypothetical protein